MYPNTFSISALIVASEDEKKLEKINFSPFLENFVKLSRIIMSEVYNGFPEGLFIGRFRAFFLSSRTNQKIISEVMFPKWERTSVNG